MIIGSGPAKVNFTGGVAETVIAKLPCCFAGSSFPADRPRPFEPVFMGLPREFAFFAFLGWFGAETPELSGWFFV